MRIIILIVVLMGLVIVQGSSSFEQVIKNGNENDNEGNKAQKVSRDISKLTGDTSDLEIKDNRNATGASPIGDKRKRDFGEFLAKTFISITGAVKIVKEDINKIKNISTNNFQLVHDFNTLAKMADIGFTIVKLPYSSDPNKDIEHMIPEILSVKKDLEGWVHCENYICSINALGLNITAGYDRKIIGVILSIKFFGFSIVDEKISLTGFKYCEPIELPLKKVKFCIEVSGIELDDQRACLNLGFTLLGFGHIFPDLCVFGGRKTVS